MSIQFLTTGEDLRAYGDYLLKEVSLPNNTNSTGSEYRCNDGLAGVQIVGIAETDIAAASLVVELLHSDTSGDSSPTSETLFSSSAGASEGDELFRFVPNRDIGAFGKIKLTTTSNKSAESISVYVCNIANR
jgi:hypothetical protein